MVEKGFDLYPNMLQIEYSKEAGFFSNSHMSMNISELKDRLEEKLNIKVGIRYKAIYHRRQIPKIDGE